MMNGKKILFVGAHPDDIEIGAGATLAYLAEQNHVIHCVIMTDDQNSGARRHETSRALELLGMRASNISFVGLCDGHVSDNAEQVTLFREHLKEIPFDPDVVFTHSRQDSHNDHRACNGIVCAALRSRLILGFYIPQSGEQKFSADIYVDISRTAPRKALALLEHRSQAPRVLRVNLDAIQKRWGFDAGVSRAEAFELIVQEGAATEWVDQLNCLAIARFAAAFPGGGKLNILKSSTANRPLPPRTTERRTARLDNEVADESLGHLINQLNSRRLRVMSFPPSSLAEIYDALEEHALIVGGAASNLANLAFIDHLRSVRYTINYDWPGVSDIRISDRKSKRELRATYSAQGLLLQDLAIATFAKDLVAANKVTISCAGIHGEGTRALLRALVDPGRHGLLLRFTEFCSQSTTKIRQLLCRVQVSSETVRVCNVSDSAVF